VGGSQGHREDPGRGPRTAAGRRGPQPRAERRVGRLQTVEGADTVGRDSRGYDVGKKINGRKRFIVTDTLGLLITVVVCAASMQDRDGAKPVLLQAYLASPARFVFADGAFAGRLLEWATRFLRTTIHIVRKPAGQQGLAALPRRWAVERSLAWLTRPGSWSRTECHHDEGHGPGAHQWISLSYLSARGRGSGRR
jgi:transposase